MTQLFPVRTQAEVQRDAQAAQAVVQMSAALQKGALLVVSTSGGKDSQAMLDYLHQLVRWLGLDPRECMHLVNADLGEAEWPVLEHLELQAKHYGVPLTVVKPLRPLLESIQRRGKWPSQQARYCTSDHKRAPIQKFIRALAKREFAQVVIHCTGERAEESPRRRKALPLEVDEALTIKGRKVWTWRPVLGLTLPQVWARIKASGIPAHPLYDQDLTRLSCIFCVFGSKRDLLVARRLRPELFQTYVDLEASMGHTFRHGFRLADIDTAEDDGMAGPT